MRAVILPGMDGSDRLLDRFRACLPFASEVITYPTHEPLGYEALDERVRARLAQVREPIVLIAESFSGPLAIRIAAEPPPELAALVRVATFARAPLPRWLRHFTGAWLFGRAPPRAFVRRYFLGPRAEDGLLEQLITVMRAVDPAVMATRVRSVLACDVTDELSRVELPVLYLEGARDRIVGPAASLAEWNRSIRFVRLDAPHLVLQHEPAECARLIVSFLAERGAARR